MSVEYKGHFRYFREPMLLRAREAAVHAYEEAVREEGNCFLSPEHIRREGLILRVDSSGFSPASATWGGDSMLKALAREAIEGEVVATIEEERQVFEATGARSAVWQKYWPQEPDKRLEQARHMLGRQILAAVDAKLRQSLGSGVSAETAELLRKNSQEIVGAVMQALNDPSNFVDLRDKLYVQYGVRARITTEDGDLVEELDLSAAEGDGLYVLAEDEWLHGRLG